MDQFKTRRVDIAFVLLILVSIAAMVNIIVLTSQYYTGSSEQAVRAAEVYSLDAQEKFEGKLDYIREKTEAVAHVAGSITEKTELHNFFRDMRSSGVYSGELIQLRYFYGDKEYDESGLEIAEHNVHVDAMREKGVTATYGLIYDERGLTSVACYSPVAEGNVVDGVAMYYTQEALTSFKSELDEEKLSYSELSAICCQKYGGEGTSQILSVLHSKTDVNVNDSLFAFLETLSNDTTAADEVKEALESGADETLSLRFGNERYVVTIGYAGQNDSGMYVVGVYRESEVYSDGFTLVENSIVTMAILILVIVVFTVYYVISRRRIFQKIEEIDTVNQMLQCPTLLKFERDAQEIVNANKGSTFAVVVSHVQHFNYVTEKYGEAATINILRHIRSVFAQAMMSGETYGYIDNGEFVLLLHYGEEAVLENRLVSLFEAARRHYLGDDLPDDYDMKMLFGVYRAGKGSTVPMDKMVEKAMEVSDLPSRTDINRICNFYDETVRSNYMIKAEIENRMEAALEAGEFRVFYQPKYNLELDRIDGAEVLVRWYNAEAKNYRSPAEFLPVFEENGFISKLDRHIYYTACENMARWVAEGKKVYPISVNISRVTAIQSDFLDYYIKVKDHFNIGKGFITLEFTESFAYENYEYLATVADRLRKAGFLCSIDDFGTGYSTYNVLKLLNMDEIKFDKFFLDKGISEKTDRVILKSVIDMGKTLGLKTTQEGVETLEDLTMLREMGCRIIQGYFFAKPMSSSDYNVFIENFHKENPILAAEKEAKKKKKGADAGAAPDVEQ